jgi:hypothetical protein
MAMSTSLMAALAQHGLVRVLQGWRPGVTVPAGRNERTEQVKGPGATEEERLAGWNKSRGWKTQNPTKSVCRLVLIQLIDDVAISKYFWVQNIRELLRRKLVFRKQLFKRASNTEFWVIFLELLELL